MERKQANSAWVRREMSGVTSDYRETVLTIIAQEYSPLRHGAKILAKHAKASYRTAEAWVAGRNAPSIKSVMNIAANCRAMSDELNRMISESQQSAGK
jgi:hypothetical protein